MLKPVELKGRPAAPGVAAGPLFRLDAGMDTVRRAGSMSAEREALAAAIARSIEQISGLMDAAEAEAAAILEFQMAMLSDDELSAPAFAALEDGAAADVGWRSALTEQVAIYETSDDDYFRARAADIADLRDRVLRNLAGAGLSAPPPGAILVGGDLTPTRFLETDWLEGGGIALFGGSASSHVAMLARSRGVPMVVGLGETAFEGHCEALVDGEVGAVTLSPGQSERARFRLRRTALEEAEGRARQYLYADAGTADGTRIQLMVNVARPDEVDHIAVETCDGVGLMRTEFLFTGDALPDEEEQYRAYAKVVEWAAGRPVTIRTIDAGGDKPVTGLTVEEGNPFLGLRGIRLSLARPEVFRVQLRALARAAAHGNLKIMLPMVTVPEEIASASLLLDEALASLPSGATSARPPLGIMVEVPAVAILPERYAAAAFFSIGSNDLTQYVTAAARDSQHVADLCDVSNPAVMHLIARVAAYGTQSGTDVSLCGDAAGDPVVAPLLLKAGLRTLSVAPAVLGPVKAAIAEARLDG